MKKWYFPIIEFRAEVGFETAFNVHHAGKDFPHRWKVVEVDPERKIAYQWSFDGYLGESLLRFELTPTDVFTVVSVRHSGLYSFDFTKHPELSQANFLEGWRQISASLKTFSESDTAVKD